MTLTDNIPSFNKLIGTIELKEIDILNSLVY